MVALAATAILSLAAVVSAQTQPDFSAISVSARSVARDLFVIDETPAHGGSVTVLRGPDGVMLVDTGVAGLTGKVDAEIRQLTPLKVRYVVNTHGHVDEIGGNEFFSRAGATLIARDAVRRRLLNPPPRRAGADGRETRQSVALPAIAIPTVTFGDSLSLRFNNQDVRILAMPKAHTDNDAIILFPALDVIVVGDVIRAGEFPSINRPDGGTLPGMLQAVSQLLALSGPQTRFVTAHGQVVGRDAILAQQRLLETARERVQRMIASGKSVDEIVAARVADGLGAVAQPGHIGPDAFVRDVYNELIAAG